MTEPFPVQLCRGAEYRGGERQVALLVRSLPGPQRPPLLTGRATALGQALAAESFPVYPVPWRLAWDPRTLPAMLAVVQPWCRAHHDRVVLHAHDSHALVLGLALAWLCNVPLVATRRSMTRPGPLWRKPTRVVAISAAVATQLVRAGVPPTRIIQIPSAVPRADLLRAAATRRPGDHLRIVAVGALTAEKGHRDLIAAFADLSPRFPTAELVLVGDGPERGSLERAVHHRRLGPQVRFAGAQPDAAAWIAEADLLVHPSRREALGTTVLEAMTLGVPVVATATGGLIELLHDGAGLLVPPDDPAGLTVAMDRVLSDAPLRHRMVEVARRRTEAFDAPGVAERITQVYRSALRDR
jgi:glycosyltransferase involved in cell wall biosynthesis